MLFSTLEDFTLNELCELFNRAFADYFVTIRLTPEQLHEKILSEDIKLDKSVGIIQKNQLVGFIFHALRNINGKLVAYNAGTGVIPEFRGKNATEKMYGFILPELIEMNVSEVMLEVMEQNIPAIKSYSKVGFEKIVDLNCYKGKLARLEYSSDISIKEINKENLDNMQNFWTWNPTWQHATETIKKSDVYKILGAFVNDEIVGYLAANPNSGRVAQFAVNSAYRKRGIGKALFSSFSKFTDTEMSIINVDGNCFETHSFLLKLGFTHFLTQHKMCLKLKS